MTERLGSADFAVGGERTINRRDAKWERANAELDRLWARGREVLGCHLAIMGGAMTWVSERNLVAAISRAGGFGVIASGSMSPEQLSNEIQATQAITRRPFGVNLITLHPELLELIDVCATHNVGHVVLAGGLPGNAAVSRVKRSGARVFCFSPALGFARKLVRMGVDAIVIEGNEAGGHIGPVSTGVLAQEILPHLTEVPVFVAGASGGARRCWHILKWARRVSSSALVSSALMSRLLIHDSSGRLSVRPHVTLSLRYSSIPVFR
jgi:hypothetical protein